MAEPSIAEMIEATQIAAQHFEAQTADARPDYRPHPPLVTAECLRAVERLLRRVAEGGVNKPLQEALGAFHAGQRVSDHDVARMRLALDAAFAALSGHEKETDNG